MNFLRFIFILIVVLLVPYLAASQTDEPKPICISQASANACRDNALLIPALNEKIAALEAQVKARDVTIDELRALNAKNVTDLTNSLHKTELALATKVGELIGCQAQNVEQRAIITALLPMVKKKRNAFITIF